MRFERAHKEREGRRKMRKQIGRSLAVLMVSGLLVALAAGAALAATINCPGGDCFGTPRPDTMWESSTHDNILGLRGPDSIYAYTYTGDYDSVWGGKGNDYVDAWDGDNFDYVNCGRGFDTVHVDSGDYYETNCEDVTVH
jgi:hypothetical protein